ncbi:DUF6864 domain-containing function [Pseudomonas sp. ICMP 460]|uniref:DUF6864 domain-containing function n=1 Tax=Pseudomonas sp. ICMP 460 TaxID=1718917 RepID=UPI00117AF0F0|nr:hypothetical protein [Pseudomonas sp. ICMP 460]
MFAVSCIGSPIAGKKLIAQGVGLGTENSPLLFEVCVPDISIPLVIDFRISDDPTKGTATATVGEIANNSVAVTFYNVTRNGPSGIIRPVSIVAVNNVDLEMQFHVERTSSAPTFLLFYTFYETSLERGPWG